MRWSEFVSDYLHFSKKDRLAIFALLAIILLVFFLPAFMLKKKTIAETAIDSSSIVALQKINIRETEQGAGGQTEVNDPTAYQYERPVNQYGNKKGGELFYFDPNTISAEDWTRLGLRPKTFGTIQNYRSKGGQFRKPEDLQKIYGLFPNEYAKIAPYVRIAENQNQTKFPTQEKPTAYPTTQKTSSSRYNIIEINSADTSAYISLPGIGSKLSARIVNFRDKLGGFYSIDQVGETFGLPDSTFQKIKQYLKIDASAIKKININTASADELKAHPYIRWNLANPIIAYRNQHGSFSTVEDLKKIMLITDEVFRKILPYLEVK